MSNGLMDSQLSELLERVGRQDTQALSDLYRLTSGKLMGVALRVVRVREHAEDVLQETFLTIWRNAKDYQLSLSPPMAWMGLIARSRALDFLRRRGAERHLDTEEMNEELLESKDDDAANPLHLALASEQAWALDQCLKKIEAPKRGVLVMAYFGDLSHSELSTQLKMPLGTVKTWVRRSLEQLRTCMSRFV